MKKRKQQTQQGKKSPAANHRPGPFGNGTAVNLIALLIVGGAVWAVYGRSLPAPFIFDDISNILDNPSITRLWPLVGDSQHPAPLSPPPKLPTTGRPLVNLTLALNYHFGQLIPAGYRAVNICVHALSAWLLFLIVRRTLRLPYFAGKFASASGPLALSVALLWALHPLQTETVVYITQRTELMVGLFYLATLYCSLRYWAALPLPAGEGGGEGNAQDPHPALSQRERVNRTIWLALATLACLAGMASKEVMVSAPLVVLLFERAFVAGSFRKAWQDSWPLYCCLAASWLLLLALNVSGPRANVAGFDLGVPAYVWWFTQAKVLLLYLKLVVWPWPLVIHYQIPYIESLSAAWIYVVPVGLIAIACLIALWRNRPVGFVGAWVFAILAPTLVVPITTEVAAERRMYLPLAALIAMVVVGGYALLKKVPVSRPVAVIGGAAVVLALVWSSVSIHRLAAYRDTIALWQDTLVHQPDNYVAHTSLAIALANSGRSQEALAHYEQALHIEPNYGEAHHNLGNELANAGRVEEAIKHYQRAIQLLPDYPNSRNNLGVQLSATGRIEEAIEQYRVALRLDPNYAEAHHNLGIALTTTSKLPEAISHFERALDLKANLPEAENGLANALYESGQFEKAVAHYLAALRLKPDYLEVHANLTEVYVQLNRLPDAIATAQKTLILARSQGATVLADEVETWLKEIQADLPKSSGDGPGKSSAPEPQ